MSSDIENQKSEPNKNDTILELQLGDVINIVNPLNDVLNNQTFIIDYIDNSKTYLINTETLERIRVPISSDGVIGDGNITKIAILSRSDTPSYARQNDLLPGKWINIHFGGDYPVILTGEITNLENDMIEIKTIDDDLIYINFDYKGLPENLPIEFIEIREKPSEPLTKPELLEPEVLEEGELEELPDIKPEKIYVEPEKIQINVPVKDIKDKIREFIVKADQVKFGEEEFGPIVQYVDVASKSQRYSIESQVSDLLDELLSTIPNAQRTPRVLNNIHIMIERFKQLREHFSFFDQYGNIEGAVVKEASFKPLIGYFNNFKINLYWIMPIVKNIKKVYNVQHIDEENNDIINIDLDKDIKEIKELIEKYNSDDLPNEQNKYSALYSGLNPYFTPFNLIDDERNNGILIEKNTLENINTIVDNLEEMYSSIFNNNAIRNRRFVIQKYNTALTKLDTVDSTAAKLVTVRTKITNNDTMSIKSFITLPEPVIRFSKINLPSTSILEKANLNSAFLNYWQLLKKKTNVNLNFVNINENEIEFNEENFANNVKNFILYETDELNGLSRKEIYDKFIKNIIPKTRVLFDLMKKYINGKLSIIDVVSYLEPFLIYSDDLTFMQYNEIVSFINTKISEYNVNFINRFKLFKALSDLKREPIIFSRAFTIIDILNSKLRNNVLDSYDIPTENSLLTNYYSNSEVLQKMLLKDYTKLYTTVLSVQNFPLMFPNDLSNILDTEKNNLDKSLKEEEKADKCKTVTIAKYYNSIDELKADDSTTVYFDKKYDKTNYGVLEDKDGYEKQVLSMSPDELRSHIMKDLMDKKRMTEKEAEYLATTLVDGHKKVIDGQFAILYKGYKENAADEIEFYIRKDNKWVLDKDINKENINTDESTILCDIQKQCIDVITQNDEKCESIKEDELGIQTKFLNEIISEFDTKYKMTLEQLKDNINNKYKYYDSLIAILTKIQTNELLKYNNEKYRLGANIDEDKLDKPVSPYKPLLNLIMGQKDFVKKQTDIIRFVNMYTRKAIEGFGPLNEKEDISWLYCNKTSVPLLPSFVFNLADSFITGGQYDYIKQLDIVKSQIGKESDDGDWWVDKNSGWTICPIDFSVEEGYEEGFKVSTRAVMEEDAGNKIISALGKTSIKYDTNETKMINNIVNTLSVAMGINIENQKEFIMNGVLDSIRDTVESESEYKQQVRIMAEKGKKMISYNDFYNTSLLYYTFGMFLIAVQTSIPSIRTRKTHPGCVRSFSGYPFEGVGDLSSLTYLGCVAYDIRESGEPWNVLKGKKQELIINKIKATINDVLLENPDVKRKFEEKTDYLLTNPATEIPEEHDIAKWSQFLPPLVKYKITHLVNISSEFKKILLSDLRNGSINQREKILVVQSKIIQFSLALIEKIQEIVKKHQLLLHTSGNEPYLENACCDTNENELTISYFSKRDPRINEYNNIVTQLSNMMEDIISYSKSGLFYSNINTQNKYPSILKEFSEKTIYIAFIYFCKFKSLIPIPEDLQPICTSKPEMGLINPNDSIDRIIQKLKEDGRNYNNEQFLRLLQIISRQNIIDINIETPEISSITRITKLLESIEEEDDEIVEKSLRGLISNSLDTFDIATENYTREVKDLNNFLIKHIEKMKEEIIEFVQQNSGASITKSSLRKMTKTIENLSVWVVDSSNRNEFTNISDDKLYTIVNFYKTFIDNFVNIFPNIILNKVKYDDIHIPNYYGFSKNHANKLKKYISEYYEKLKIFYGNPVLQNILITIQKTSKNLVRMANATPCFTSIKISEDKIIKPVFDERTSRFLFEYYLLRILINYIDLSDIDEMIVTEIKKDTEVTDIFAVEYLEEYETRIDLSMTSRTETQTRLLTGNKKDLRQKTSELIVAFVNILNNQKDTIDTSYEEIQDRVFKLREREKDMVTDRLKKMTDEERDADTILKINKLGMYSKGMLKGLTTLDKEFYDEEQEFREKMTQAERKIRKTNVDANDENIDILLDDYFENEYDNEEIDAEAYDMGFMNETFFDGNTDGVGAPEEEYEDYQDDN
jgi:hypothetical protein